MTVGTDPNHKDKYNGTFQVTAVSGDGLKLYYNLADNPGTASGEVWLDKVPKTSIMHIESITQNDDDIRCKSSSPLFRKPGQYVQIGNVGVTMAGVGYTGANPYHGVFPVKGVDGLFVVKKKRLPNESRANPT